MNGYCERKLRHLLAHSRMNHDGLALSRCPALLGDGIRKIFALWENVVVVNSCRALRPTGSSGQVELAWRERGVFGVCERER